MDNLINLIGGYNSGWFWVLVVASLLGGAVLIAILKRRIVAVACGVLLEVFGAVMLLSLVGYTVDTTPGLPQWSGVIVPLFAVAMIVGVVYGLTRKDRREDKEDREKEEQNGI